VAVFGRVGHLARAAGIDDDDDESSRHQYFPAPALAPVTMATLALAPSRLAPASTIFCASAVVRTPPDAFTPTSSPTTWRMSAMSSAVAPPGPKPVEVFTKAAPAAFDSAQPMIFSSRVSPPVSRITFTGFGFAASTTSRMSHSTY